MKTFLVAIYLVAMTAHAKDSVKDAPVIHIHGVTESLRSWKVREAMEHVALTNPRGKSKIVVHGEDGKTYTLSINGG